LDLKVHKVTGWLNRRDTPEFWERAADICGLYLDPPVNALVLSVDEKTAIAARSPKHPTRPVAPGKHARREFEYVRRGTACLMAALDVASGQVLGTDVARNDAATFIEFLAEIHAAVPPELDIHLVLDNGSSQGDQGVAGRPPSLPHPLHPAPRVVAEPGLCSTPATTSSPRSCGSSPTGGWEFQ